MLPTVCALRARANATNRYAAMKMTRNRSKQSGHPSRFASDVPNPVKTKRKKMNYAAVEFNVQLANMSARMRTRS